MFWYNKPQFKSEHFWSILFFFFIFKFAWDLSLAFHTCNIYICLSLLSINTQKYNNVGKQQMHEDTNPPFRTTYGSKSRILCWSVKSLISGHKLYFLRHISDDRFGSSFKDKLLLDEGGDGVRCWFLLVGFHSFLCILRKSRVFHQNSKGLLQFDLFSIEDVMSDYKDW